MKRFPVSVMPAAIAITMLLAAVSLAAPVNVPNFSFEDDVLADGTAVSPVASWFTLNGGAYDPLDAQYAGTTGDNVQGVLSNGGQFAYSAPPTAAPASGNLSSNATFAVSDQTTYTLTVAVGQPLSTSTFSGRIELLNAVTGVPVATSGVFTNADIPAGSFVDYSTTPFTTIVGDPLSLVGLKIRLNFDVGGNGINWDNVRLDATPIPEPSSLILLGTSSLAMLLIRRRRRDG